MLRSRLAVVASLLVAGNLASSCADDGCTLVKVIDLQTDAGSSGAPLVGDSGVLALLTSFVDPGKAGAPTVYGIRIDRVQEFAAQFWEFDWKSQ